MFSSHSTRSVNQTVWLLYQIMSLLRRWKQEFFVRNLEQISCPCCDGSLSVIGSRKRKYFSSDGNRNTLVIRRLRCRKCRHIHHELPDILVPYKRYDSESIESTLEDSSKLAVAADDSTIGRWRSWFEANLNHFLGCLVSIATKLKKNFAENTVCSPKTRFQRVIDFVGNTTGWLARVVRSVANTNNWVHTRSAFLSGKPGCRLMLKT